MLPIKPLLSQNVELFWGDELQESFIKAKEEIHVNFDINFSMFIPIHTRLLKYKLQLQL